MTLFPRKKLISVHEYHLMGKVGIFQKEDKVELINGEIFEMAKGGSHHSGHVIKINSFFYLVLRGEVILGIHSPVHLNELSEPEPDISVCKPREDSYITSYPTPEDILLLIEVAKSSLDFLNLEN